MYRLGFFLSLRLFRERKKEIGNLISWLPISLFAVPVQEPPPLTKMGNWRASIHAPSGPRNASPRLSKVFPATFLLVNDPERSSISRLRRKPGPDQSGRQVLSSGDGMSIPARYAWPVWL